MGKGRIGWLGIFCLLGCAQVCGQAIAYRNPQLLIETEETTGALADPEVRLLDVRSPDEYRLEHLPGAVNLPAFATDDLEANRQGFPLPPERAQQLFRQAGVNAASHVVIYDDQGNRFAARVFYVLEFFGHMHVRILNGGFAKWQWEGRPTTTEVPRVVLGDFTPAAQAPHIATSQWVASHLKDPGVILVDARSPAEFRGEGSPGSRGGHIPGAVNIEWTRVITTGEAKTFLSAARLEQLFSEFQVVPDREIVTYCQTGMRAAEIYFALRLLGFEHVRIYDGSWQDWGTKPGLPFEK